MFWTFENGIFLVFWTFLSDEVETVFWENEAKHWELFQSKSGHRKYFKKMVLKLLLGQKQIFCAFWNGAFHFCANTWGTKLKPFSERKRQRVENLSDQSLVVQSFLENSFEATLWLKANATNRWTWYFSVFCNFWVAKVKPFSGKERQSFENCL